ncbi:MAG TPA: SMP-30/gluconolactonase/LRE family protein [Propionibacteriaceae bacterium]|nr:SMP-30/gluconolactonase/LRE family protein [Propionibacteriaceae bacterium]
MRRRVVPYLRRLHSLADAGKTYDASNGLQWNRVGDTVFYADTPTGRVDSFDFDPASAAFTDRRTFIEISGGGYPDGMAIDDESGVRGAQ